MTNALSSELAIGTLVAARYRLEKVLGQGANGVVYRAWHCQDEYPVVLKTLLPEIADDPIAMARFEREALVTTRLDHPHIVSIIDFGAERDYLYIVMEYLDGETLGDFIRRNAPLSIPQTLDILEQILSGLQVAHQAGIIHRDLKPPNVYVCRGEDQRPWIKLIDFGIAKPKNPDTELTQAGFVMGTPGFVAPELFRKESATEASDIYAVGAMAYEMLVGKQAYTGSTPLIIVTSQMARDPDPPPPHIAQEALWRVVDRMLARDPLVRYQHAGDILEDLEVLRRQRGESSAIGAFGTIKQDAVPKRPRSTIDNKAAPTTKTLPLPSVAATRPPPQPSQTTVTLLLIGVAFALLAAVACALYFFVL